MKPVIGENEKSAETLAHKQQHKRKRSNSDTSLYLESGEQTTDDIPERAVGTDGHYYLCVKCDNDGELLCCDSCACTYHLQCLDPPLDSTPEGVWQCGNCEATDISVQLLKLKRAASDNRNNKEDGSYTCFLCARTNKVLLELSEDESDKPKSPKFNSEEENLPADTYKGPKKNQKGSLVCNDDRTGTSKKKFRHDKPDKLLILREVLLQSMKDLENEKSKQNNDKKTNAMPDSAAAHSQAALAWKDKYAKLRTRQKAKLCATSFKSMAQQLSSDVPIATHSESDPSYAIPYRWGGASALLSSNTSLFSVFSSTAMGGALSSIAGTSSDANADSMIVVQAPTGLLKRKAQIITWSENELDALWVGVRRYGAGHWDAVRGDPSLKCLKEKTNEDLSNMWNKELPKIFNPATVPSDPSRLVPPQDFHSYPKGHPLSMTNESVRWRSRIPPPAINFGYANTRSTVSWAPQWSPSTNSKQPVARELFLGGYFPLPNFGLNQNMNAGHSCRETQTLRNPDLPVIAVDNDDHDKDD